MEDVAGRAHVPVLLDEVLEYLQPKPGGRYLDGTLGLGGHSEEILRAAGEGAQLLGLDRDERALERAEARLAEFGTRVTLMNVPFSRFQGALDEMEWDTVDGALVDLGISSFQLDEAGRGFSFALDGPLDMRMGRTGGEAPASRLVNKGSVDQLKRIIWRLGEEPMAGRIARAIFDARQMKPIETTLELAEIVSNAYPAARRAKARNHPATRTFMALRMTVNQELDELETFLAHIPDRLAPGGRVAVISFHSLEDRLVKRSFRAAAQGCTCPKDVPQCVCGKEPKLRIVTKKPVGPGDAETAANPRARSAKLRVAERLA
ncbi:MAG: 16S rRNA (cytosine(1402)-N(4))-methyltransferase RsmH [Desulfovibrio sp.]|nr:MAG: 16S rRNA (cytosine(1402)-N(4))-methyltransferase RsmH [Desulfovibrio sp.]